MWKVLANVALLAPQSLLTVLELVMGKEVMVHLLIVLLLRDRSDRLECF